MAPSARDAAATACDRQDRQRNARSRERPPGSSHPHLPAELAAVFVEEIFLAVCTAIAAVVKRHTQKHSNEGNEEF